MRLAGDKLLHGIETSPELYNLTGSVRSELRLKVTREVLGNKIVCKVANEVMEKYLTAFVQIDVNLRPVSTVVSGEKEYVEEGEEFSLVCSSSGARPAAEITWYNGSLSNPLVQPSARHISSLQEDGTYATISQLLMTADRHHNNNTLYCQATNEVTQEHREGHEQARYRLKVRYSPVVEMMERVIVVNESAECSVTCGYDANPATLLSITWLHNNVRLNNSNPKYKTRTGDKPSLTITNIAAADSGNYSCWLTNLVGEGHPKIPSVVEVQTRPRVRLRMDPLSSIREGDVKNVTLNCEVEDGHPAELTTVQWFMDRILLQQLPRCEEEEISPSSLCGVDPTKLILESVNRHFHGNFSCIGINKAGPSKMSMPASLIILPAWQTVLSTEP